jgi:hypothetical protein
MNKKMMGALLVSMAATASMAADKMAAKPAAPAEAKPAFVCQNNTCKGHSDCSGFGNDSCKGNNECKGHGTLERKTKEDCEKTVKKVTGVWVAKK